MHAQFPRTKCEQGAGGGTEKSGEAHLSGKHSTRGGGECCPAQKQQQALDKTQKDCFRAALAPNRSLFSDKLLVVVLRHTSGSMHFDSKGLPVCTNFKIKIPTAPPAPLAGSPAPLAGPPAPLRSPRRAEGLELLGSRVSDRIRFARDETGLNSDDTHGSQEHPNG